MSDIDLSKTVVLFRIRVPNLLICVLCTVCCVLCRKRRGALNQRQLEYLEHYRGKNRLNRSRGWLLSWKKASVSSTVKNGTTSKPATPTDGAGGTGAGQVGSRGIVPSPSEMAAMAYIADEDRRKSAPLLDNMHNGGDSTDSPRAARASVVEGTQLRRDGNGPSHKGSCVII